LVPREKSVIKFYLALRMHLTPLSQRLLEKLTGKRSHVLEHVCSLPCSR
jgi:hypothetical protein